MVEEFIESYYGLPLIDFVEWMMITIEVMFVMLMVITGFTNYIEQEIQKTERGENPELFTVYRVTPNGEKEKIEREKVHD